MSYTWECTPPERADAVRQIKFLIPEKSRLMYEQAGRLCLYCHTYVVGKKKFLGVKKQFPSLKMVLGKCAILCTYSAYTVTSKIIL